MVVIDFGHLARAEVEAIVRYTPTTATVRVIDVVGHTRECHICPWGANHDICQAVLAKNILM